jgi:hypothetical protein
MVTRQDYGKSEVNACLSVLVELMTILGEFRDYVVLVGGWIPYFLLENSRDEHVGSLDIDIALDFQKISNKTYRTILQMLENRGYKRGDKQPFIYYRTIRNEDGRNIVVEVDLLAGEYGGTSKAHRTQLIQDVRARKVRGCDLVFEQNRSLKVSATMPDGSANEVIIKIADIIPFLVMKGMSIWERYKEKDAYDIYFTILNYPGGIPDLVKIFEPVKSNKLVKEGLGKIKAKFKDVNSIGPKWIVTFQDSSDEEEKEMIRRDAYERINAFLDKLGIEEYI